MRTIPTLAILTLLVPACITRSDTLPVESCAVDAKPPTWSYVSAAVMQPSCGTATCHSTLTQKAGVILDSPSLGYRSLVEAMPEAFVQPGAPQESRVMYLLAGVDVAKPMPPDAPLPAADIDLVRRWICAGAEDN